MDQAGSKIALPFFWHISIRNPNRKDESQRVISSGRSGDGYGSLCREAGLISGGVVGGDGEIISPGREVLNRIGVHVAGINDG
jgi:hypothetical protein